MEAEQLEGRRALIKWIAAVVICAIVITWILIPDSTAAPKLSGPSTSAHKRIPVYYWHMWSGEWLPVMDHVCDEFNASQEKYEVIPLQVPFGESDQKFLLSVAGGNPPDVMTQWTPAISTWAQSGILQPLDQRLSPAERKYFMNSTYPVVHQNGWYKGKLYGLLVNYDVYACYYRPSLIKAAGLDPNHFPTSMESLVDEGNKLTVSDPNGHIRRLGFLPTGLPNYLPAFGGGYPPLPNGSVDIASPQNIRAMKFIADAHKKLGYDNVMRFNAGLGSDDGANWSFINGQVAIILDGEWRVTQLAEYAPKMDYGVALLPPPTGGIPYGSGTATSYLTIPTGAKHAEGAWEFIKFWEGLDDPARGARYKTWFCWMPDSPQMAAAPIYQQFLKKYPKYRTFVELASSNHIVGLPPVPYSVFLQDHVLKDDDLAERGALSPVQAIDLLQAQINQEEKQRKALGYDQ